MVPEAPWRVTFTPPALPYTLLSWLAAWAMRGCPGGGCVKTGLHRSLQGGARYAKSPGRTPAACWRSPRQPTHGNCRSGTSSPASPPTANSSNRTGRASRPNRSTRSPGPTASRRCATATCRWCVLVKDAKGGPFRTQRHPAGRPAGAAGPLPRLVPRLAQGPGQPAGREAQALAARTCPMPSCRSAAAVEMTLPAADNRIARPEGPDVLAGRLRAQGCQAGPAGHPQVHPQHGGLQQRGLRDPRYPVAQSTRTKTRSRRTTTATAWASCRASTRSCAARSARSSTPATRRSS